MAIQTKGNKRQKKRPVYILVLALMIVLSTSVLSFAAGPYTPADRSSSDRLCHTVSNGSSYCVFSNDIKLTRNDVKAILIDGRDIADYIVQTSGLCFHKSNCTNNPAMSLEAMNNEPNVHAELITAEGNMVEPGNLQPLLDDSLYTQDVATGDKTYSVYFDVKITENGTDYFTMGKSRSRNAISGDVASMIKVTVTVPRSAYRLVTVHEEGQPPQEITWYEGEDCTLPSVEKQGYELVGWFTDAALIEPFDPTTVRTDVDIYPKWQEKTTAPAPVAGQGGDKKQDPKSVAAIGGDQGEAEETTTLIAGGDGMGEAGDAPKIKVKGNVITKIMDKGLISFSAPTVNIPFKGGTVTSGEGQEKIDALGLGLVSGAGLTGLLFAWTIASDIRVIHWFRRRKVQLQ